MEYICKKIDVIIALFRIWWTGASETTVRADEATVEQCIGLLRQAAERSNHPMSEQTMRSHLHRIQLLCNKHGWKLRRFGTSEKKIGIWRTAIIAGPTVRELERRETWRMVHRDEDTGVHLIGNDAETVRTNDKREQQVRRHLANSATG